MLRRILSTGPAAAAPPIVIVPGLVVAALVRLLPGPARLGSGPRSAETALLGELKKLLATDAQTSGEFGASVAITRAAPRPGDAGPVAARG